MSLAVAIALVSCGLFFLAGLAAGVWKYRCIMTSANAQAPVYVDVCHRSSLLYAFACLVLAEFAKRSAWSSAVNAWATAVPIAFFASAVGTYAVHGALRDTDNQLARPHRLGGGTLPSGVVAAYMAALIFGEIGGFLLLFAGFLRGLVVG
jgi:hypothetical protein